MPASQAGRRRFEPGRPLWLIPPLYKSIQPPAFRRGLVLRLGLVLGLCERGLRSWVSDQRNSRKDLLNISRRALQGRILGNRLWIVAFMNTLARTLTLTRMSPNLGMPKSRGSAATRIVEKSPMPPIPRRAIVALILATLAAYAPALKGPFVFDDIPAIVENPTIRGFSSMLSPPPGTAVSGRPVANVTLAANFAVNNILGIDQRPDPDGPYKAVGYRLLNIILHLCTGALLFGVLRRAMRESSIAPEWRTIADPLAGVVCTLWLLHPIQSETVNYVVQRTESLASLFYLSALYASIRAWDTTKKKGRVYWYSVAIVAAVLGVGSKEIAISIPFAVLLYDRAFRYPSWRSILRPGNGRGLFYLAILAACAVTFITISFGARGDSAGLSVGAQWQHYFYSQCWVIAHYLRLVFWPSGLTLDYGDRAIVGSRGIPGFILLSALGVATLVAWTRVARWGWFAYLGTFFFMVLAPSSSFIPIRTEIAAERRIYLALAAVLVVAVVGAVWLRRRFLKAAPMRLYTMPFAVIAIALFVTTAMRSRTYARADLLWRDAMIKVPTNRRATVNLGIVLLQQRPPRFAEADSLFRQAIAGDSDCAIGCAALASSLTMQGRLADAVPLLERTLAHDTRNVGIEERLAILLMKTGQPARAIPHLEQLSSLTPTDMHLVSLGAAYLGAGRREDAIAVFRQSVQAHPNGMATGILGSTLNAAGRPKEALPYLEQLVHDHPRSGMGLAQLSLAYAQLGDSVAADAAGKAAIQNANGDAAVFQCVGRSRLLVHDLNGAQQAFGKAVSLNTAYADSVTSVMRGSKAIP